MVWQDGGALQVLLSREACSVPEIVEHTDWQGPGKANKEKKKAAMRDSMQHSFLHVKLRALHQTPSSA